MEGRGIRWEANVTSDQDPGTSAAMKECKFCRERIHRNARICRACGEPQYLFRRCVRFGSAALSSLVALGSLGIAYAQYYDAMAARDQERAARAAERAEAAASEAAIDQILANLDEGSRRALSQKLSTTLTRDRSALEREKQTNPANVGVRRDLLLQKIVPRQR